MVAGESRGLRASAAMERPVPPIDILAIVSLALIVIGGIYLAAYVPRTVPLFPAVTLLVISGIILAANGVMLSRLRDFAWERFMQVFKWALLAYVFVAGMIGYAFVTDGTRGSVLVILLFMLIVFALNVPLLLAFSVARYAEAPGRTR